MSHTILSLAKQGDREAFGILYDMSYEKVYRSIFHRTLDTYMTEDIISQVYMKAMRSIVKFHGETEWEFFSWVLRIAHTTFIDATRTHHETESVEEMIHEPGYETDISRDIDSRDTLAQVLEYMEQLSPREKSILTLRIWDELSYEEIAEITGESVANSKKIVSRTLEKIAANVSYCFIFWLLLNYVYHR